MRDLAAFGSDIELAIHALVSPEERRTQIQAAADELLEKTRAEIRGSDPRFVRHHKTFVDGRPAENLDRIDPDHGTVTFRVAGGVPVEVVQDVLDLVQESAPVLTGAYRDSLRLYADRQDVTDSMPLADARAETVKEFAIMPTVPYGRKLERHVGVLEAAAAIADHRFGNQAIIYFEFRSPVLPYVPGGMNRAERQAIRGQPSRIRAMRAERQTRMPCVVIRPLERA